MPATLLLERTVDKFGERVQTTSHRDGAVMPIVLDQISNHSHRKTLMLSKSVEKTARLCHTAAKITVKGSNKAADFFSGAMFFRKLRRHRRSCGVRTSSLPAGDVIIAARDEYRRVQAAAQEQAVDVARSGRYYVARTVTARKNGRVSPPRCFLDV